MPKHRSTDDSIAAGLAYLKARQRPDGGFESYSTPSGHPRAAKQPRLTTFVPSLMLAALSALKQPTARTICDRLSEFVWEQRSPNGGFNYWAKAAPERRRQPYPDDLDDTFCALVGLQLYRPQLIDEAVMADVVKLLLATETAVGGPYRTWLVSATSEPEWLDVDIAVNSVVAYFLSQITNRLPALDRLMANAVRGKSLASPYYPDSFPLLYYLSRVCPESERGQLRVMIQKQLQRADLHPLALALCLTASVNLDEPRPEFAERLISGQRADGSWANHAFCADPVKDSRPYVHGAAALTTAFALEALQRTSDAGTAQPVSAQAGETESISSEVLALAARELRDVPAELRQQTLKLLGRLAHSSTGAEIVALPFGVRSSFGKGVAAPADEVLLQLSLANLYGWLAYSIYDDLLDGEGQTNLLPAANLAMRCSISGFSETLQFHRPFQQLVKQVFNQIDNANAWEVAHGRFGRQDRFLLAGELPDYGDLQPLADRSLGHMLPPLAVLLLSGVDDSSPDFNHMQQAMSHYLIARQLNDDAHDWPEDLVHGRITYVVGMLLAAGPAPSKGKYALRDVTTQAHQQFWRTGLPRVCQEIRRQVKLSRDALREIHTFKRNNHIAKLLDGIEASVKETLAKHRQAQAFLKHYEKSSVDV